MNSLRLAVRNPIVLPTTARRRLLSTESVAALLAWKDEPKQPIVRTETLHREQLASLFATLPTRDGSSLATPSAPPEHGSPLPYGHHLVFFNPRTPERALRADRTDPEFCPPAPFTRRMWAGGEMRWSGGAGGLRVGMPAVARARIADVLVKGLEGGRPMVFVDQEIEYAASEAGEPGLTERRTHVYLPERAEKRGVRPVKDLPTPDFEYEYLPTPTMLFRFSALTFNAHLIHLDKHYATELEGYPERLVHGPLTALMLLEATSMRRPSDTFKFFRYRALNPLVVDQPVLIKGAWDGLHSVQVWAESAVDGTVGMTGQIDLTPEE